MTIPPLNLQMIYEHGRPTRAIIDIGALEALLEAAEDLDDIRYLNSLKEEDLEVVSFDEYLRESERRRQAAAESEMTRHGEDLHTRHREAG